MTREEKQKAIDALKISAPVMTVTQEEFNDYIQTLNQVMDWLEQEPKKGHWEYRDIANSTITGYWCDQCHIGSHKPYDYCPSCGSYNGGEQHDSM